MMPRKLRKDINIDMKYFKFLFLLWFVLTWGKAFADEPSLLEISTENLIDGGIKVLFILDEVADPKMFYYRGDKPRVVCDFNDVRIKPGLRDDIRVNNNYIEKVRLGEHLQPRKKVRAVLDLVSGYNYDVQELPVQVNIFSVVIKTKLHDDDQTTITKPAEENPPQQRQSISPPSTIHTPPKIQASPIPNDNIDSSKMENENQDNELSDVNEEISDLSFFNKWPSKKTYGDIKLVAHMETDDNGFACIKGYIINNSDDFYYRILLDFDVYNYQEDLVEVITSTFFNIKPGERRKLQEFILAKTPSRFRISDKLFW